MDQGSHYTVPEFTDVALSWNVLLFMQEKVLSVTTCGSKRGGAVSDIKQSVGKPMIRLAAPLNRFLSIDKFCAEGFNIRCDF